tara:strand:+ start:1508 stop:1690 length:183 start_codon:yes stop_codon:yes gene_type:complete
MKTAKEAVLCSFWKNSRAILHPEGRGGLDALVCLALIAALDNERLATAAQKTLDIWDEIK